MNICRGNLPYPSFSAPFISAASLARRHPIRADLRFPKFRVDLPVGVIRVLGAHQGSIFRKERRKSDPRSTLGPRLASIPKLSSLRRDPRLAGGARRSGVTSSLGALELVALLARHRDISLNNAPSRTVCPIVDEELCRELLGRLWRMSRSLERYCGLYSVWVVFRYWRLRIGSGAFASDLLELVGRLVVT